MQSQPDARSRNDALRNVFNSLMEDAIMTPLFKYNYRISAPPGVNGLRLNARGWFDFASAWLPWIYKGLTLLLIGCPCALVISTPAAITSGLAVAARRGA
ncbi:hypothetical protein K4H04_21310, partial [Mycobacterium tuberculosis]|nr:hypothetical protein [Mycobacterium tuberculosis]